MFNALTDILEHAPALQCFFTEFGYAAVRDAHECGYLAAIGLTNLTRARSLFAARGARLARLREEFRVAHRAVKTAVGNEAHMDGAYDKLYVRLRDPQFPLRLLPPYQSASESAFSRFRAALPPAWMT